MDKKVLETIQEIIYKETGIPVQSLSPDKSMSLLDIDSLSTLTILVQIEDAFGVKLVDDMSNPDITIQEIVLAVIDRKV